MFSFCVDQVSRMEYKPEGEDCECRRSKDDLGGSGKGGHRETSRTKKVSSPAALGNPQEQGQGKNSHFFGRTKKVSAPPSAQFEALLSAACHLREAERERKKSAHDHPAPAQNHGHHHHHHIFQQRHQAQHQQHHQSNHLQRQLAHHHNHYSQNQHQHDHGHQQHQTGARESTHQLPDGGRGVAGWESEPVAPQRRATATHGGRKERKKGSAMAPPTLEQLEAAVLEEAAKHGKKNTGPAHPLNIFGRTKKVSAPPVAQFEALLAANAKMQEDQERKRSVHTPGANQNLHQHHHYGHLHHHHYHHHHQPQRLDNLLSPEPALLSQRKCMAFAASGQKKRPGEEADLRLDGLWISRCEGEVGRAAGSKTPAEVIAHELDSALAAVAKRRKEMSARAGGDKRAGLTPAEALGAEMDSALAAALLRRERKLTVGGGQGKEWSNPRGTAGSGHNHLHRSTEMLSRG